MIRQYELVERVRKYDPNADEQLLNRAYVFSMKAHGAQKRASGDPYFSHPLEVAGILTEFRLDCSTIVTALLHDTIEDTVATYEQIEALFGKEIATLVDGVTKLSKIEFGSDSAKQAENFRKLLVAMSNDIRVLLVKLVDRLHNMRTLKHIPDADRRQRIALETMEIYAPLAERIGMREMKDELEDLAFEELNLEGRNSILQRTRFLRKDGGKMVQRITRTLNRELKKEGVGAQVLGREKRPYSIWRKMERKEIGFEQLSDIIGFRIIVDDRAACYQALGIVHAAWPMVPGSFKDYISMPKPNGYQSLHTTILGPEQRRIELQIRTKEMHEVADFGVAAHWQYKQGMTATGAATPYRWLRELLEILESAETPEEFLEHTKLEMFDDQVFCFTPAGDLIVLPRSATAIDFAYAVHTEIGNTCVGAKVNGRLTPLRAPLENGDQVEIICSDTQSATQQWENLVATGKARSAIRQSVRKQKEDEFSTLGKSVLEGTFRHQGQKITKRQLGRAALELNLKDAADLYTQVGRGNVSGPDVFKTVYPEIRYVHEPTMHPGNREGFTGPEVPIEGLVPGLAVHYGACCHPLPGDRIVGIVNAGHGINIHTVDCASLEEFHDDPDLWCDVSWNQEVADEGNYVGRISVVVENAPGALGSLSGLIAEHGGNICNLNIMERTPEFYEMAVDIEVHGVKQLAAIVGGASNLPIVRSAERTRS